MCEGYCYSEIFYNNKTEKTIAKAWGDTIANPTKTEIKEITKPRWKELINSINLSEFYSLASTIGCPDCADGGESWIEIKTTSKEYRVNYEYGKTPKPIEKLIELIEN